MKTESRMGFTRDCGEGRKNPVLFFGKRTVRQNQIEHKDQDDHCKKQNAQIFEKRLIASPYHAVNLQ